ncbi:MAG: tRNA uridine-5-carboxymethylaminomethyl(34) synthesis GTPase MnmE [Firmicutes bacterium]|nr:tRNA uridine-5-carboxymethylaminomethyl(34) synthesis GTPase MnmE [Bacillota bacterium]
MLEDTIAAISTPPGEGGIGIVRMSGSAAEAIGLATFNFASRVDKPITHHLYYGHVINPINGKIIDEALISFMRAPHTFTREDVVEVNCHGGILPLTKTLEIILAQGARMATPGEFTQRAFLNGRIDLAQAEAVIQVIRAKTDIAMELGVKQLVGQLSREVSAIRKPLLTILAHVEASIDYPEHQDVEELARDEILRVSILCLDKINTLVATADKGRILREGIRTAIVGSPNVGKSSLLNVLLGQQRAIVTDIPGTTRDVLEESLNVGGVALTIVDTAGIRDTADEIERMGVERSRQALADADLILYVLDVTEEWVPDNEIMRAIGAKPCIIIANKVDLLLSVDILTTLSQTVAPKPLVAMSATEMLGLTDLEEAIIQQVFSGSVRAEESIMVTSTRHKNALLRTHTALSDVQDAINLGYAVDLIAIDLHSALEALGEITGENIGPDLVEEIFSNFCIGK